MLQEEENIQQGLVKFGKRVLEAAHTMETRLQAAFAGDDDSGMEEHMPPAAPLNQRGRTVSLRGRSSPLSVGFIDPAATTQLHHVLALNCFRWSPLVSSRFGLIPASAKS